MAYLVERGWVCVTVNHRLGPHERRPAMIVDVRRAFAWVKEHITDHGGDPSFVAISGGSAGGHLASLAAVTANDPAFRPGFADADTSVVAAVPVHGVHDISRDEHGLFPVLAHKVIGTTHLDDADTWRAASPLHRVTATAPPFLVVHGSADTIVSVGQSRRMREVGAEVRHAELPHTQHGFDAFPTARTAHHVRGCTGSSRRCTSGNRLNPLPPSGITDRHRACWSRQPDGGGAARGVRVTVLVWILGGTGLWVVAAAILSLVMGRLIGQAQSERDSYDELRAAGSMPAPPPVTAPPVAEARPVREPDPETSPIPMSMPRQQAAPAFAPFVGPRIPQPRPQPHLPCPAERPASRG
jgi:dienelactone hydrolase